ncbi:MAG: ATP-binding protein [Flavobacteriales bacterium]|nr:ATP-binding protein [Flavobacteriales bacterium]MBK9512784.1 ATP-binding protein [Flavobacteriales bacterium]MBP7448526.1 ATP-binding protein [Flavobacteriales bacterium]
MLRRAVYHHALREALERSPVVMLAGPRQCGKSTLAKELLPEDSTSFFDLEDPTVRAAMSEPMTTLRDLRGLVVIDEAQRHPELFPVLRVLADRRDTPARFLLLGSASPELSRQSAESLAGRVELIELRGFDTSEVGTAERDRLWVRGGFPRSFLAKNDVDSYRWRQQFISTFLERDLGVLGFGMAPKAMERFWKMLSHYHGQIWNASEIAASMGVSPHTTRSYLDALEQTYMVRTLQPWYVNLGKRLVKSPKIYLRDSGIFHNLQGIRDRGDLLTHPKLGASWEGFALEEVLAAFKPDEAWYYAVHSGSELDLFFRYKGKRIGVEFKRQDAPRMTKSMRVVMQDLELDQLYVIYPGTLRYTLDEGVEVVPLDRIATLP